MAITDLNNKIENGGVTAQGKLSAAEFNTLVNAVIGLLNIGGHTDVAAAATGTASGDMLLFKKSGTNTWTILLVDGHASPGSDSPITSDGVYEGLTDITGRAANYVDGKFVLSTGGLSSDGQSYGHGLTQDGDSYFPCSAGDSIEWHTGGTYSGIYLCFYDSSKTFISYINAPSPPRTYTAPANTAYIRFSYVTAERASAYLKINGLTVWKAKGAKSGSLSDVLRKVAQILTTAEKAQVKENIGLTDVVYADDEEDTATSADFDAQAHTVWHKAQTLSNAQKAQARENIGAGTSSFSGSYNDLTDKPTIPDISGKANKVEMTIVVGTGDNADKTTITLKSGLSTTLINSHQPLKTINGESIIGEGNIVISGGGGGSGDTNVIETVKVNGTALTPDANKAVDIAIPETPTLSSAPTSSTTSYTKNGNTINFVVGQFARVAKSGGGYDMYQLFDVTSGTATWVSLSAQLGDIDTILDSINGQVI